MRKIRQEMKNRVLTKCHFFYFEMYNISTFNAKIRRGNRNLNQRTEKRIKYAF